MIAQINGSLQKLSPSLRYRLFKSYSKYALNKADPKIARIIINHEFIKIKLTNDNNKKHIDILTIYGPINVNSILRLLQ